VVDGWLALSAVSDCGFVLVMVGGQFTFLLLPLLVSRCAEHGVLAKAQLGFGWVGDGDASGATFLLGGVVVEPMLPVDDVRFLAKASPYKL
jgi:hypothetical protein